MQNFTIFKREKEPDFSPLRFRWNWSLQALKAKLVLCSHISFPCWQWKLSQLCFTPQCLKPCSRFVLLNNTWETRGCFSAVWDSWKCEELMRNVCISQRVSDERFLRCSTADTGSITIATQKSLYCSFFSSFFYSSSKCQPIWLRTNSPLISQKFNC